MSESDELSLVGRVLAGVYQLEAELGRGAMGVVYRARHLILGDEFAVKVLSASLAEDEHVRGRFLQEARALTRLTHSGIVPMRHFGDEGGMLYVVMGFVQGETLTQLLEREGRLPEARATDIVGQILDALGEAHRVGVVHRDLKPDNVMIETQTDATGLSRDHVRVLDFGLARIVGDTRPALPSGELTLDGDLVGTVAYMSPEQVRAAKDVDGRSDLFGVGVMLYEMLTGRRPFESDSVLSVMMRILEAEPILLPTTSLSGTSTQMHRVVSCALAKDPATRFQSASEFKRALAQGVDPSLRPPPKSAVRPVAVPAWLWAIGALFITSLALWWMWRPGPEEASDPEAQMHAAVSGCEPRQVLAYAAQLQRVRELSGEEHLILANARTSLGDASADRELVEAGRMLGDRDWRVHLARALRYLRVPGSEDHARALDALALAVVQEGEGVESLIARLELTLDDSSSAALAKLGLDTVRMATGDLETLRQRGVVDARVEWCAGLLLLRQVDPALPLEERLQRIDAAIEALSRGSELAAQQARGPHLEARAWLTRSQALRAVGRYEEMDRDLAKGLGRMDEAVRRVEAHPNLACQVQQRKTLLYERLNARLTAGNVAGALQDLRRVESELTDVRAWSEVGGALRNAGEFAEAEVLYERLAAATQERNVWFDLGYCRERLGMELRLDKEREKARAAYVRAEDAFGRARESDPGILQSLAYRGEVRLRLSELDEAQRSVYLERAGEDFEEAAAKWQRPDQGLELDYRYSEYLCLVGRSAEALERMEKIVGGSFGLNPSAYGRTMQVALVRGVELHDQEQWADSEFVLAAAVERAKIIRGLQAYAPGSAFSLAGDAQLITGLLAELRSPGAGQAALQQAARSYQEAYKASSDDPSSQDRMTLALAEVAEAQASLASPVVAQRLSDLRAGYLRPSGALYRALAVALGERPDGRELAALAADVAERSVP